MPVLQPVSDTASCGPRHVMLLLSLWASSQFLKQTRALSDVLLEAPGEGGELAEVPSCSAPASLPSACPSSSPGGSTESLGMQQGVRISFRSHPLSPASGRASAVDLFCWMERAAALLMCFTPTDFFWSFATAEFSLGSCLPKHLERRFATLFL